LGIDIDPLKHDAGKIQAGVLLDFRHALMEVAKVGTFGTEKYSRNSWRNVENAEERYMDALWRHLLASDDLDEESGLPHLAHLAWNILAIMEFRMCSKQPYVNVGEKGWGVKIDAWDDISEDQRGGSGEVGHRQTRNNRNVCAENKQLKVSIERKDALVRDLRRRLKEFERFLNGPVNWVGGGDDG